MSSANTIEHVDVVVVGAGLAGLTAARDLVASGLTVRLVEARDRVGGRVFNGRTSDGSVVELGGQWIGPGQDRLAALADDLGVEQFPTYDAGDKVLVYRGRHSRYRGTIPRLPVPVLAGVGWGQLLLDRMASSVPLEDPWSAKAAERWDAVTVETWMRRHVPNAGARRMLALAVTSVFAAEPRELSLLHFLFYSHSGGLIDRLLGVTGGAQERRFVGGSQEIALRLADRLGEIVTLSSPVRRIEQDGSSVRVLIGADPITEAKGHTVVAEQVVVAVPPVAAGRIDYQPALPAERDQLTQRLPMGSVIKAMAVYDEPFWRAAGLCGQATSDEGPVQITFDNSPPSGRPGVLLAFLEGERARQLGRLEPRERRSKVVEELVRFFGSRAAQPVEYLELDWAAEPWTRGCYGAHAPPGVLSAFGPALRRPCGRIHWAGTETSPEWCGYMDGAVRSGERVARQVVEHVVGARSGVRPMAEGASG